MASPWTIGGSNPEIFADSIPQELLGKRVLLQTPEEFAQLPDGTELYSIMGKRAVKGVDEIDDDTRGGHLAFGILQ